MSAEVIQLVPRDDDPPAPIINLPHLVSIRDRLGALAFSLACWLYFLLPVAILGGWLAGLPNLAQEVVALGGWRRFQSLVDVSGKAVIVILLAWLAWSLYLLLQYRRPDEAEERVVDDATLCAFFGISLAELPRYRASRVITIHFEEDGRYRELVPQDVDPITASAEAGGGAVPLAKAG